MDLTINKRQGRVPPAYQTALTAARIVPIHVEQQYTETERNGTVFIFSNLSLNMVQSVEISDGARVDIIHFIIHSSTSLKNVENDCRFISERHKLKN